MTVANKNCIRLLAELEELKRRFGTAPGNLRAKVRALGRCEFDDADALIRFHEALLFIRAYPPSAKVLKQVEEILKTFEKRVSRLRVADADLSRTRRP